MYPTTTSYGYAAPSPYYAAGPSFGAPAPAFTETYTSGPSYRAAMPGPYPAEYGGSGRYDSPPRRDHRDYYDSPPRRGSGGGGAGLREDALREHDRFVGAEPGPSRKPNRANNDNGMAETVASSVGTQWRSIVTAGGTRKKVKTNLHPSRMVQPYGKKIALLIGVDDESHAASNSINTVKQLMDQLEYSTEVVVDMGDNPQQFDIDAEAGLSEIIALSRPGDCVFLYAINYGTSGRHCASSLIHRLATDLTKDVRVTCFF
eukprot:NODE_1371_length_1764_cov_120.655088_g1302_i0.p1 GENE.NODE_1371_length_1764_cov_120.655088_g1302_i0~~NODE_1371_length_1764_cov_120.655088_g1302_i0.p1  ORF type:complete len:260 (+),score=52.26 NODE_1371_length_1764_cov_120.655088_g1302_i0:94-873(+)